MHMINLEDISMALKFNLFVITLCCLLADIYEIAHSCRWLAHDEQE